MRAASVILSAVGAIAGLSALGIALSARASGATRGELDAAVAALSERHARHEAALATAAADAVAIRSNVHDLAARAAAPPPAREAEPGTEAAADLADPAVPADPADPAARADTSPARAAQGADESRATRIEELRELGAKVLRDAATAEERERFFRLSKEDGLVDALTAAALASVDAEPESAAAHMQLADAYLLKLYSVPGGPEQGLWGERAEQEWKRVAEIDPEHWDARFRLAESWSYYPDVMNKTGDAVALFERLRQIQEARTPEPRHALVYGFLHRLYLRQGEREKAEEALAAGLRRHPEDEGLRKGVRR